MIKQHFYHYEVYCTECKATTIHRVTMAVIEAGNVVATRQCEKCGVKQGLISKA